MNSTYIEFATSIDHELMGLEVPGTPNEGIDAMHVMKGLWELIGGKGEIISAKFLTKEEFEDKYGEDDEDEDN